MTLEEEVVALRAEHHQSWIYTNDGGFLGHAGTLPGFNTQAGSQPGARATIVVLTNSDAEIQTELQEDKGRGPAQRLFYRLATIVSALQRAA